MGTIGRAARKTRRGFSHCGFERSVFWWIVCLLGRASIMSLVVV